MTGVPSVDPLKSWSPRLRSLEGEAPRTRRPRLWEDGGSTPREPVTGTRPTARRCRRGPVGLGLVVTVVSVEVLSVRRQPRGREAPRRLEGLPLRVLPSTTWGRTGPDCRTTDGTSWRTRSTTLWSSCSHAGNTLTPYGRSVVGSGGSRVGRSRHSTDGGEGEGSKGGTVGMGVGVDGGVVGRQTVH